MKHDINFHSIRRAALILSRSSEAQRNAFLSHLADEIARAKRAILSANARDVAKARAEKLPRSFVERLILDAEGLAHLSKKVLSVKRLKSGLGEVIETKTSKGGPTFSKVRAVSYTHRRCRRIERCRSRWSPYH